MSGAETLKRAAAERAVDFVENGMVLGLGTGSTARHVVEVLAERLRTGALVDVLGVATSRATAELAGGLGIPLATLDDEPELDLTIDGADEVDPALDLIKGLGGALLWEKIVATASDRLVIVVDESKLVRRLGSRAPVPVEVVPFGWRTHEAFLEEMGAAPALRRDRDGTPFITDGGHYILDCRFPGGITDALGVDTTLGRRVGLVETGLFVEMTDAVVVAAATGVRVHTPDEERASWP
jgi:ribose 5-phosphate isomerase A